MSEKVESPERTEDHSTYEEIFFNELTLIETEFRDISLSLDENVKIIQQLRASVDGHDELFASLESRLLHNEVKLQSVVDLTDDVLTNASHAIEAASEITDLVVVLFSIIFGAAALIGFGIQIWFSKSSLSRLNDAKKSLLDKIGKEPELQNDFLRLMFHHPEFMILARKMAMDDRENVSSDGDVAEMSEGIGK